MLNNNEDGLKGNIRKRLEMKEKAKALSEPEVHERVQKDQDEENYDKGGEGHEKPAGDATAIAGQEAVQKDEGPEVASIDEVENANVEDPQEIKATSS